jgi:predicted ArsR family transcriptional regulator
MKPREVRFRDAQRERLSRYLELRAEVGDTAAREALLQGYPERQRALMGPYITDATLVEGISRVLPVFGEIGIAGEVIDASTDTVDSAIEILTACMCANACEELEVAEPIPLLCELDCEASRRAFPDLTVEALSRKVDGKHVCVFRYRRPAGTRG